MEGNFYVQSFHRALRALQISFHCWCFLGRTLSLQLYCRVTRDLLLRETPESLSESFPDQRHLQAKLFKLWLNGHSVRVIKLAGQCYANEQDWRLVRADEPFNSIHAYTQ